MTPDPRRRFDTFTGVFLPTLLTILGVIMYVRLGWVVGNAGLIGAFAILILAMGITLCTGLSLASIATNTRIGDGGPYAIIARSLGLEVGGSIGVPLFLTRPLGVAMYVFGFREGWLWLFPGHDPLAVDLLVFAVLFGIAYKSADLAFRVQYFILAIIVLSLVSIFASPATFEPASELQWFGDYAGFPETGLTGTSFWVVFAVFFPATTGILAGANMSGELKDPRRAIPVGALSAIAVSSVIYFALCWWAVRAGTPDELVSNYTLFIDEARWGWLVLAGLLGATASSALAGLVGGPRILMAMGKAKILPASDWAGATAEDGEPRNAMLLTGVLTLACLMVRDLNAIAPLVTMFFLITYGGLNFVVLLEGGLGLVSFRPTLRVPQIIPLVGLLGCLFAMFIVNPTFGLISILLVVLLYAVIQRRGVPTDGEDDVRSSIFVAVAEWAAAHVTELDVESKRAWKPNLLVPVEDPEQIRGEFNLLMDVSRPEGSVKLLGLTRGQPIEALQGRVQYLSDSFRKGGVYCTWSVVEEDEFGQGVIAGLQALRSAFFRPNLLFLTLPELRDRHAEFALLIKEARATHVGVALLGLHPAAGLGQRRRINLWIRPQRDWSIDAAFSVGSLNLTLLMGYRLMRMWKAEVELVTVILNEDERGAAEAYMREIADLARIPSKVGHTVLVGRFDEVVSKAPIADLNIMGLQPEPDFHFVNRMVEASRGSCLMVLDSGRESALA